MIKVEVLIYIAMALLFISGVWFCLIPLIRIRSSLKNGANALTKKRPDGSYCYMDPYFLHIEALDGYWVRFLNNLELMKRNQSVCEVTDFINYQTAIHDPGRSSYGDMLPGMLTTLGIIGTFYGVVHGLSFLDISSTATMQETISILIAGMHTAFNTSIVGALLSVIFQLVRRIVMSGAERSLNNFVSACQAQIMSMLTPEATFIQIQHAILVELQRLSRSR